VRRAGRPGHDDGSISGPAGGPEAGRVSDWSNAGGSARAAGAGRAACRR
jgi:hypothetical protein